MAKKAITERLSARQLNKLFNNLPNDINKIVKLVCGRKIASGAYRDVYELKEDPLHYVVKIERRVGECNFTNACEWRNYINYQHSPLGDLLCPVELINESGSVLVMRRAVIATKADRMLLPKILPAAITDTKYCNFGFIDGKVVIVDYPFLIADQSDKKIRWKNRL